MRKTEAGDTCCGGVVRGILRSRVCGVVRTRGLLLAERRFVNEQVGALRELDVVERGRGVPCDQQFATRPRRAEYLLRRDDLSVSERDRLAALQTSALRTGRDAERIRGRDVETAGPLLLDEGVAECGHAVCDEECDDAVVAAVQN